MRNFAYPGRSPVYGTRAMVATSHPLASVAAIEKLKSGGNAVDAAIAATAVMCVVEPAMTGIGGDCFAIIAKPGAKADRASTARARADGGDARSGTPRPGITAIADAVAARRDGAGCDRRVGDAAQGLRHALASPTCWRRPSSTPRAAMPCAPRVGHDWANARRQAHAATPARAQHLLPGRPRAEGRRDHALARPRARRCARSPTKGRDAFYTGEIAADMVAELRELGGLHTLEDFAAQKLRPTSSRSRSRYRGADLLRDAAEQPGHRRADHAQDPRALRHARRRAAVGRALSRPDGGGPARLRDARHVRRRSEMANVPVEHMLSDAYARRLAAPHRPQERRKPTSVRCRSRAAPTRST